MENELTCCVCLEMYSQPLMLPCFHNFCKKCLEDLYRHSASAPDGLGLGDLELRRRSNRLRILCCPKCRKEITLDLRKGISSLPHNKALENIVNLFSSDCTNPESFPKCRTHEGHCQNQYCQTCKKSLCDLCVTEFHSGFSHNVGSLGYFIEGEQDCLKSSISECEALTNRIKHHQVETTKLLSDLETKKILAHSLLKERFTIINSCLRIQEMKLRDDIDDKVSKVNKPIRVLSSKYKSLLSEINMLKDSYKEVLKERSMSWKLKRLQDLSLRCSTFLTFRAGNIPPPSVTNIGVLGDINVDKVLCEIREVNITPCCEELVGPACNASTQTEVVEIIKKSETDANMNVDEWNEPLSHRPGSPQSPNRRENGSVLEKPVCSGAKSTLQHAASFHELTDHSLCQGLDPGIAASHQEKIESKESKERMPTSVLNSKSGICSLPSANHFSDDDVDTHLKETVYSLERLRLSNSKIDSNTSFTSLPRSTQLLSFIDTPETKQSVESGNGLFSSASSNDPLAMSVNRKTKGDQICQEASASHVPISENNSSTTLNPCVPFHDSDQTLGMSLSTHSNISLPVDSIGNFCGIGARPKSRPSPSIVPISNVQDDKNMGTALKEGFNSAMCTLKSFCGVGANINTSSMPTVDRSDSTSLNPRLFFRDSSNRTPKNNRVSDSVYSVTSDHQASGSKPSCLMAKDSLPHATDSHPLSQSFGAQSQGSLAATDLSGPYIFSAVNTNGNGRSKSNFPPDNHIRSDKNGFSDETLPLSNPETAESLSESPPQPCFSPPHCFTSDVPLTSEDFSSVSNGTTPFFPPSAFKMGTGSPSAKPKLRKHMIKKRR